MTARVPSGSACTVSRRERTLIVSRLPTCSADLLECCARNARGSFGLTQTIPRGATVGVRLHRVNVTFRRPTSGLTQVATANPASMADGVTVSSPSVVRPSRISDPGCQAAPERPLFVLWISVDTGITAMPRARHGAGATEVLDRWDTVSSPIVRAPLGAFDDVVDLEGAPAATGLAPPAGAPEHHPADRRPLLQGGRGTARGARAAILDPAARGGANAHTSPERSPQHQRRPRVCPRGQNLCLRTALAIRARGWRL
jgi:hypothetical protein